jgi:hypothetical protein
MVEIFRNWGSLTSATPLAKSLAVEIEMVVVMSAIAIPIMAGH